MFIPTTQSELKKLKWDRPDIILVSGDTYIDSPNDGIALIGKVLLKAGYKVAVIAQPDISGPEDIKRLGEPKLFWGVSSGCVDSMVANYTALKKKKKNDDLTPGGENNRRPDRAVIAYVNLIKKHFKNTKPIVIGGIEASLRRIAHYDFWSDKIRRSILFDSKADVLVYGMAEKSIVEIAGKIRDEEDYKDVRGICYIDKEPKEKYFELPPYNEVNEDKLKFIKMFHTFYRNNDPVNAKGLCQKHDNRYLIQNPPAHYLTEKELDDIFAFNFERDVHPYYKKMGKVKSLDTIRYSITSHRGCYGECNFCAITVHQGRTIRSRSRDSIAGEAELLSRHRDFKGYISDIGGPTANMYGDYCAKQLSKGSCKKKRCISCGDQKSGHKKQIKLLKKVDNIKGIKKAFVGSGIRYDLVIKDEKNGMKYLEEVIDNHISGQMKIAPEHIDKKVLKFMAKPSNKKLVQFKKKFDKLSREKGKKQFLTYYFIAAHPGCELEEMYNLKDFVKKQLKLNPEQVQIFTPTPSTYSTLMYYTGLDPFTLEEIYIEKDLNKKRKQKEVITPSFKARRK